MGQLEDRGVPLPRGVCFLVEVVEPAIGPELVPGGDPKLRAVDVDGDRVGGVGLKLDRVGTCLSCCPHNGQRLVQITVMVARHLGDDEPVSYTHLRAHETDSYIVCRLLLEEKNT